MKNLFKFLIFFLFSTYKGFSQTIPKSVSSKKDTILCVVNSSNYKSLILSSPPNISSKDVLKINLLNHLEFSKKYQIENRSGIEFILKPEVELYNSETFFKKYNINKLQRTYTIYVGVKEVKNLKEFYVTKTMIKHIKIDTKKKRIDIDFNP